MVGRITVPVLFGVLASCVSSLLFFLCTFLKEDFSEHFFLLLVGIIVFHIVIAWLIENEIVIMVAVGVLVADSPGMGLHLSL